MKRHLLDKPALYILPTLIIFSVVMIFITPVPNATNAAPAPTATPVIVVTPTPGIQHWLLANDGDMAYLLTQPGCYLTMQELGQDSRVFTLECDPVRGEGVDVELKYQQ